MYRNKDSKHANPSQYKQRNTTQMHSQSQHIPHDLSEYQELQTLMGDEYEDPLFAMDEDMMESQLAYEDELMRQAEEEERQLERLIQRESTMNSSSQQSKDSELLIMEEDVKSIESSSSSRPKMSIAQMYASKRVRTNDSSEITTSSQGAISSSLQPFSSNSSSASSSSSEVTKGVGLEDISWADKVFQEAEAAAASHRQVLDERARRTELEAARNRQLLQTIKRDYFAMPSSGSYIPSTDVSLSNSGQRIYFSEESIAGHAKRIRNRIQEQKRMATQMGGSFASALEVNMEQIRRELKEEEERRAKRMFDEHAKEARAEDDERDEDDSGEDEDEDEESSNATFQSSGRGKVNEEAQEEDSSEEANLWVSKYAPESYSDLLSSESCNRTVVQWLKTWDRCVFGGARLRRRKDRASDSNLNGSLSLPFAANSALPSDNSSKKSKDQTPTLSIEEDKYKFGPDDKVILLSGPPGAGKTTLAHIAAAHCGYRILEVNASDDRSADTLKNRIRAVTETQSVIGGRAPNLLVIDEIDGAMGGDGEESAGKGAIGVLVDVIRQAKAATAARRNREETGDAAENGDQDEGRDNNEATDGDGSKTDRRSKKITGDLRRPIICICNNLYAPALRPLLPHVKVIQIIPIEKNKLVDRLRWICSKEKVAIDGRALSALSEITECDIRSCLHTLQMAASRSRKARSIGKKQKSKRNEEKVQLTVASFASMSIGQKDMAKDNIELWHELLSTKSSKSKGFLSYGNKASVQEIKLSQQKRKSPLMNDDDESSLSSGGGSPQESSMVELWSLLPRKILDTGAPDRVMDGLHHNYLFAPLLDAFFARIDAATDWFCVADILFGNARVRALGGNNELFAFASYVPYAAVAIRTLMAGPRRAQVELPKLQQQQRNAQLERHAILDSFMSAENSFFKQGISKRVLVTEILSSLCDILTPKVNSSVLHLLSPADRNVILNLVDTLISIDCTFRRTLANSQSNNRFTAWNSQSTNAQFQLEPDLDKLLKFSPVVTLAAYGYGSMMVSGFFVSSSAASRLQRQAQNRLLAPNPSPLPGGNAYSSRGSYYDRNANSEFTQPLPAGYTYRAVLPIASYLLPSEMGHPDPSLIAALGLASTALEYIAGYTDEEYRRRRTLPQSLKEAIAHEVEFEKLRRSSRFYEELAEKNEMKTREKEKQIDEEKQIVDDSTEEPAEEKAIEGLNDETRFHTSPAIAAAQAAAIARRQAIEGGSSQPEEKPAELEQTTRRPGLMGYFSRSNQKQASKGAGTKSDKSQTDDQPPSASSSDKAKVKHPLYYAFQEGFSNAVRRPVKMSAFL